MPLRVVLRVPAAENFFEHPIGEPLAEKLMSITGETKTLEIADDGRCVVSGQPLLEISKSTNGGGIYCGTTEAVLCEVSPMGGWKLKGSPCSRMDPWEKKGLYNLLAKAIYEAILDLNPRSPVAVYVKFEGDLQPPVWAKDGKTMQLWEEETKDRKAKSKMFAEKWFDHFSPGELRERLQFIVFGHSMPKLSIEERAEAVKKEFKWLDKNDDGVLSREEYRQIIIDLRDKELETSEAITKVKEEHPDSVLANGLPLELANELHDFMDFNSDDMISEGEWVVGMLSFQDAVFAEAKARLSDGVSV